MEIELIFVYNADSGLLNSIKDYVHKLVSPGTYPCNLCAVTYGNTGMKKDWKDFISDLEIPTVFIHKNAFLEKYSVRKAEFPAVFVRKGEEMRLLINAQEIDSCKNLFELKKLVEKKVKRV